MNEIRNFVLIDDDGKGGKVFNGREPRQAALKVANQIGGTKSKPIKIVLRERITKKVYVYMGWREPVHAPKIRPDWMPDIINKPFVRRINDNMIKDKKHKEICDGCGEFIENCVCEYESEPKSVTILGTKGFKTVKIIQHLKAL